MKNFRRKILFPAGALVLALVAGLFETVALNLARRRVVRYR